MKILYILFIFIFLSNTFAQDINNDGLVNTADRDSIKKYLGKNTTSRADITGDGKVDGRDYFVFARHYNEIMTGSLELNKFDINLNNISTVSDSIKIKYSYDNYPTLTTGTTIFTGVPGSNIDTLFTHVHNHEYLTIFFKDNLTTFSGWTNGIRKLCLHSDQIAPDTTTLNITTVQSGDSVSASIGGYPPESKMILHFSTYNYETLPQKDNGNITYANLSGKPSTWKYKHNEVNSTVHYIYFCLEDSLGNTSSWNERYVGIYISGIDTIPPVLPTGILASFSPPSSIQFQWTNSVSADYNYMNFKARDDDSELYTSLGTTHNTVLGDTIISIADLIYYNPFDTLFFQLTPYDTADNGTVYNGQILPQSSYFIVTTDSTDSTFANLTKAKVSFSNTTTKGDSSYIEDGGDMVLATGDSVKHYLFSEQINQWQEPDNTYAWFRAAWGETEGAWSDSAIYNHNAPPVAAKQFKATAIDSSGFQIQMTNFPEWYRCIGRYEQTTYPSDTTDGISLFDVRDSILINNDGFAKNLSCNTIYGITAFLLDTLNNVITYANANKDTIKTPACSGGGGGTPCTGSFAGGFNESFESGEGLFCTTGWIEDDTNNVILTYSADDYFLPSHCLKMTCNSGTSNPNVINADLGAEDTDFYIRWYFLNVPDLASSGTSTYFNLYNDAFAVQGGIRYAESETGEKRFYLHNAVALSTQYFILTQGQDYFIDLHYAGNSVMTAKCYSLTSAAYIDCNVGGGDKEIESGATTDDGVQYIRFLDDHSNAADIIILIDDIKLNINGTGYIGGE